jgi:hypothetical protein
MTWSSYLTLGLAVIGAVLGVMNTWNAISQRRLQLRVRPAHAIGAHGVRAFSIEVINLSAFAVTINDVGFIHGASRSKIPARSAVLHPTLIDGGPWPRRLESREAVSVFFDPVDLARPSDGFGKAYARTSCGEIARGDSPALRQLRQELRG